MSYIDGYNSYVYAKTKLGSDADFCGGDIGTIKAMGDDPNQYENGCNDALKAEATKFLPCPPNDHFCASASTSYLNGLFDEGLTHARVKRAHS